MSARTQHYQHAPSREFTSIRATLCITTIAAVVPSIFVYLFEDDGGIASLGKVFAAAAILANSIGFPARWIMPRLYPAICRHGAFVEWTVLVIAFAAISSVGCAIGSVAIVLLHLGQWSDFRPVLKLCVFLTLVFGLTVRAFDGLRNRLAEAELKLRTEELERERAIKLATEARLSALEARLHPHFLFNTLNSISSLIPADPERAERLVERMAALLRFSLDAHRAGLVPLEQEMKIVRDYLDIESARLGQRLRYSIEASAHVDELPVPPLSVQTLVENSIKFAIAPNREGGEIRVSASRSNGCLYIDVADTGAGFAIDALPAGHGLDNLKGRLAVLFGDAADLRVHRENAWTTVRLKVPV